MSALSFRNVDASPGEPPSKWPLEAVHTTLERGALADWRSLAREIRREPWGPVARAVEEVLSFDRPYGIADVMDRLIAEARESAEAGERTAVANEVSRLIERSGLSQADFASRIGTSGSRLSTYASGRVTPSASMLLRMRGVKR